MTKPSRETTDSSSLNISEMNVSIGEFYFGLIDDCNEINIPLFDMHLNRFHLFQKLASSSSFNPSINPGSIQKQGSAEFSLNLNYFNRFLSGWEPLVEPWLARVNWKLRPTKNILTITSMDVLNINVTNTFVQLINDVMQKWKADMSGQSLESGKPANKLNKVFQPYKLINLTGQQLRFIPYQYNDVTSSILSIASSRLLASSSNSERRNDWDADHFNRLNDHLMDDAEWISVNDKCDKQFSFLALNASKSKLR